MSKKKISRRSFLGQASCAAVGTSAFLNTALNLGAINTLAARPHILQSTGDYKAMVCLLLAGGCDTHNVLIPTESSQYSAYATTRGDLALSNTQGQPAEYLDLMTGAVPYTKNGQTFGVHAGMPGLQQMFSEGDAGFIANVGTLIEPIANKVDFESGLRKVPLGLYSHSDQIMQWQTSVPQSRSAVGVGGRLADLLHDMNSIPEISMNISLAGKNRFQAGNQYNEYSISRNATADNIGYDGFSWWQSQRGIQNDIKRGAIDSLAAQSYDNIFQKTYGELGQQTAQSIEVMRAALSNITPLATSFTTTNISTELKKIAELISVRSNLGAQRQVFFVTYGGWDHHDNVLGSQQAMLPILDEALTSFNAAMKEVGVHDKVATFTISDFGRTLTSNGNGSDHAWGGNQIIMGGPFVGGEVHGDYPTLDLTNPLNLHNRGRFIPTTSVDEMYAELALWFGASPNDLDYLLPNLCNFYASSNCTAPPSSGYAPIGLFS
jgi:uncharacterized protein (DUF1501 family)